jgi:hypothetical protein
MGHVTSATKNRHMKSRQRTKLRLRGRQPSIGVDGGAISGAEVIVGPFLASRNKSAGVHAEVVTHVDQELPFASFVRDEKAVCRCRADMCRPWCLLRQFPCCWWAQGGVHFRALSPKQRWYQQRVGSELPRARICCSVSGSGFGSWCGGGPALCSVLPSDGRVP